MSKWNSTTLPDFTVYGFHTGALVDFKLKDGSELTGTYQGWGIFRSGYKDYDPEVAAWRPSGADSGSQS